MAHPKYGSLSKLDLWLMWGKAILSPGYIRTISKAKIIDCEIFGAWPDEVAHLWIKKETHRYIGRENITKDITGVN